MTKDLYSILGVDKKADDVEIRKAYRRLARRYHPDVSEEPDAEEKFKDVQQAYEVLKDPERRAHYDATGGVDSETINPPRDILMSLMKDALIFAINMPMINIAATIQQGLDDSQDNINKRIAVLKDALRHMKRLRNTVRRKKEGQLNLFHVVVDREIAIVTNLVEEKLPALLKHLMEARRMYKDYERGEASDFETAVLMIGRTHK